MLLVFDCSAVIACVAPDEAAPERWRALLAESSLVCPALWPAEVVNAILSGTRRKRFTLADSAHMLTAVKGLNTEIEPPLTTVYAGPVLDMAREHGLTVYDASYLELAQRRRLQLATLDGDLIKAAKKAKVRLI